MGLPDHPWAAPPTGSRAASSPPAAWLAAYAVLFALAYVGMSASTGTLALFGTVQVTMLASAIAHGERPPLRSGIGFLFAIGAMVARGGAGTRWHRAGRAATTASTRMQPREWSREAAAAAAAPCSAEHCTGTELAIASSNCCWRDRARS